MSPLLKGLCTMNVRSQSSTLDENQEPQGHANHCSSNSKGLCKTPDPMDLQDEEHAIKPKPIDRQLKTDFRRQTVNGKGPTFYVSFCATSIILCFFPNALLPWLQYINSIHNTCVCQGMIRNQCSKLLTNPSLLPKTRKF